jgi:hypothetical protein
MAHLKYFAGTEQVFDVIPMNSKAYAAAFGDVSAKRYDSYSKLVGFARDTHSCDRIKYVGAKPVTRVIEFKANPSLHKCGTKCRHAKGGTCECECGGKYHGAGN